MADDPFDIGHLHASERMRIQAGDLSREERAKLMRGENPWPKPVSSQQESTDKATEPKPTEETIDSAVNELREHVDRQLEDEINAHLRVPKKDIPEGEFRDVQPSQSSPEKKPPGEFDDIKPIGTFDAPINNAIQNEPHFTVLEDSGPGSRLSELLNKIPVWKEFSPWLKWGSGFFALAATMTQLGEYGWAMLALVLCGLCCLTQIAVWTASASIYKNGIWKAALFILSMALIVTAGLTLLRIKGDKPWSNLQGHQSPVLTPTPSPLVSSLPFQRPVIQTTPSPTSTPTLQLVKPNPSASLIVVPSGFTAKPESAQLVIEGGTRQNVLALLRAQEKYKGPGAVLQFEVLVINSEGLFAGGESVNDKTGLPITESRYWQQVDISDLYFYMQKTGRVAITFVWLKPLKPITPPISVFHRMFR
jgi:hypothetical protein